MGAAVRHRKPWKKILYEQQAYPDNHVDESFLNLLLLNAEPVSYSYAEAVEGTLVLTQRLVIVAVFVVAFLLTLDETMSVNTLIIINVATLVGGYGVFVALTPSLASGRWRSSARITSAPVFTAPDFWAPRVPEA